MTEDDRFTIARDASGSLIRYAVRGFWDEATVDRFCRALEAEVVRASIGGRRPRVLADATGFAVQRPIVAKAFETAMFRTIVPRVDRLAILVGSALAKLQVERGAVGPNLRTFLNEAEALAWLNAETSSQ